MGKEKLDDNADNVDQPAAMQPDDNQEAFEGMGFEMQTGDQEVL